MHYQLKFYQMDPNLHIMLNTSDKAFMSNSWISTMINHMATTQSKQFRFLPLYKANSLEIRSPNFLKPITNQAKDNMVHT